MLKFILFLLTLQNILPSIDSSQLLSAFVIYRHGNRTPVVTYPKSKYKEWPEGFGALTNIGKQYEYKLGQQLKNRYIETLKLVDSNYVSKDVYFRSSDTDRCLMSAQTQAAGMFPPTGDQIWNKNISWQPIPIQTILGKNDYLLKGYETACQARDTIQKSIMKNIKKSDEMLKYKDLLKLLTEETGMVVDASNFWKIYDVLHIVKLMGKPLPVWLTDSVMKDILDLNVYIVNNYYLNEDINLRKYMGGYLLKYILENMISQINLKVAHETNRTSVVVEHSKIPLNHHKLQLLSAHDATIWALFGALGIKLTENVPFSASVSMELWKHAGEFWVELYYNDSPEGFKILSIPNCENPCNLLKLIALTKDIVTDDPKADCFAKEASIHQTIYIVLGISIVILMLSNFTLLVVVLRNSFNKNYNLLSEEY